MNGILEEIRAGYQYPSDWNEACRANGLEYLAEPEPGRAERVGRAVEWGAYAFREKIAAFIEPRSG